MKGVFIFFGGVLTGIAATSFYLIMSVIPNLRAEIEKKCREDMNRETEETLDEKSNDISSEYQVGGDGVVEIINNPVSKETLKKEFRRPSKDYSKCFKDDQETPKAEEKTEEKKTDISGTGPYVISANEFDEYSNYTARTFLFYSDGVVLEDETEEILDADPETVFGKTAIEELKKPGGDSVVFVRCDETKSDYRLELVSYPFDGFERPMISDDWGR